MEDLMDKLHQEKANLLRNISNVQRNKDKQSEQSIHQLKSVFQELELVAAAATPFSADTVEPGNPNPAVLTAEFYASYMVVLLLAKNLNDARFLWKRIAIDTKQSSQVLVEVWEIGKALWKRDFTAAYTAMNKPWPQELGQLVEVLRLSTRNATAELLSVAYSTISITDATLALGFSDKPSLVAYVTALGWQVSEGDEMVRPKPMPRAPSHAKALQQLELLSDYVLHLEQSTVIKLP